MYTFFYTVMTRKPDTQIPNSSQCQTYLCLELKCWYHWNTKLWCGLSISVLFRSNFQTTIWKPDFNVGYSNGSTIQNLYILVWISKRCFVPCFKSCDQYDHLNTGQWVNQTTFNYSKSGLVWNSNNNCIPFPVYSPFLEMLLYLCSFYLV